MNLCKYSNIFGSPNIGVHKYRLFDIAVVDVVFTVAITWLTHKYFYPKTNFTKLLIIAFGISIVAHRLFCVNTTVDRFLFN